MTAEERAMLWLSECAPIDYRTCVSLLREAGSPKRLFEDFEKFSKNVLKPHPNGLYNIERSVREKEADELIFRLECKSRFAITLVSEDYPAELKEVYEPPLVLYGEGNRSLLKKKMFCVVGSRITPPWAEKLGMRVAEELAREFVIVTGLADGGDSAAIRGAIESGNLISVLPCGLDDCYPASQISLKNSICKKGLLLSEFPFHERVGKGSFHARNRILAGLGKGVFVMSAGMKSGTLITANLALDSGKEVFVFPYNVCVKQGEGCNELIKSGARLVTGAEDILSAYGFKAHGKPKTELSETETRVLEALQESGELHMMFVAERAGIPVHEASAILTELEIKGLVTKSGGNKYTIL